MKRIQHILLVFFISCSSCDLLQWNLEQVEYSNYERASGIQVGSSPKFKTEIIEDEEIGYYWPGIVNQSGGLINYSINDALFQFQGIRQGYNSNTIIRDNDTILLAFNGDSLVSLLQFKLDVGFLKESSDLFSFINSKLGLVTRLSIQDMHRYNDIYLLAGEIMQTVGGSRSVIIAVTRKLEPLWVRTYISNSFSTNIEVTKEGEIYLAGIRNGHNYILKTNISGDYFDIRDFTLLGRDSVSDMRFHNGSLYFTSCFNQYPFKTRIVSFDRDLKLNWFVDLSTIDTNHPVMELNRNGNLVIGYASYSLVFISELNSSFGTNVWCNRFEQDRNYFPKGIIQTADFGYFLAAESANQEYIVIKTDEEGATRLHPFRQSCQ